MADQTEAPYLDAVVSYVARNPGRFHIPGHKGIGADPGLIRALGEAAVLHDVPAGIDGIDVGPQPTPFQRAQRLAADAWGARRSWFLLNGASGGNHAICMTLAHATGELATGPPDRGRIVVQRNVHSSIIDGLVISGLRPTFVAPEIDPELGIAHCVTPEGLEAALTSEPEAVAAMLVSPTYFGAVARVAELAEIAHAHGVPLVVDEAWGSHLYFHEGLPAGALRGGADMVLSSTHKIVGSFTQSAILHLGDGGRVDEDVIDRSVTLVESTSPNALLTASLDAARRFAATRGHELLDETLEALQRTRERVREIQGLDVLDERLAGRTSVAAWDPLRLSIDVRGTGATGHRIAGLMRDKDDIVLELFSENVVVAVFGIGETAAADGGPAGGGPPACRRADRAEGRGAAAGLRRAAALGPAGARPARRLPRAAGGRSVLRRGGQDLRRVPRRIPARHPNVLPGERLTAPTIAYIADSLAHGGLVRGASDRSLKTIRVVME